MYCDFFGLRCRPFEERPDTRFHFATSDGDEALAAMEYGARHGKGATLILGKAGCGKTLLLRTLLQRLHTTEHAVVLTWPSSGNLDLIRETCKRFGVTLPAKYAEQRCLARLKRHLLRTQQAGHRSILIVDQAENLSPENIGELMTLSTFQSDGQSLLNIVVVGQPQIRTVLAQPEFASIRQQLFGERLIQPLSMGETIKYVAHRLSVAGAGESDLFDLNAVERFHSASQGLPRLINHMCDAAMLAAYGAGEARITDVIAQEVISRSASAPRSVSASHIGLTSPASLVEKSTVTVPIPAGSATYSKPIDIGTPPDLGVDTHDLSDDIWSQLRSDEFGEELSPASIDPVLSRGEALLGRLERAMDRAERIAATTETSTARHASVEKHLTALANNAERLSTTLGEAVHRGAESLELIQRKSTQLVENADARLLDIEARTSRARAAADHAQEHAERLAGVCEKAECVEAQLAGSVDQFADKAAEVQERVTQLMAGLESTEDARRLLDALVQKSQATTSAATERINSLQSSLDANRQAGDRVQDNVRTAIESFRSATSEAKAEAARMQEQIVEDTLSICRKKLATQLDAQLREQDQILDHAVERHSSHIETIISESTAKVQSLEQLARENGNRMDELCAQAKELTARRTQARDVLDRLTPDTNQLADRVAELAKDVQGIIASVSETAARAESVSKQLVEVVPQGEKLVGEMRQSCGQVDAMQRGAAATLLQVGSACEKINNVRDQLAGGEDMADRIASAISQGGKIADTLTKATTVAGPLVSAITTQISGATEQAEILRAERASAAKAIEVMSRATATGQTLVENVSKIARDAKDSMVKTREQLAELTELHESSMPAAQSLSELVGTAGQINDALQGVVAHADEKIGQLDSHSAAASRVMRELIEASHDGHSAVKQLAASEKKTDEAATRVEQAIKEVWDLTGRTEVNAKDLASQNTRAIELVKTLRNVSDPATEIVTKINTCVDQARSELVKVSEQCEQAGNVAKQLGVITEIVDTIKATEASVLSATDNAKMAGERLLDATNNAISCGTSLDELNATAHGIIETQGQIKLEADRAADRLEAQLSAANKSIERCEPMMRQFIAQARTINQKIEQMKQATDEVGKQVENATVKPAEIVAAAQQQAAQLENVVGAVRKVFSNLSKASLEARKDSANFIQTSTEAHDRLEHLTAETDRAACTLQEWVEEAIRIQTRLEHTVQLAPTIGQTHPGASLQRLAQPKSASRRLANASALTTDLAHMNENATGARGPIGAQRSGSATTRSREISQMIEEAKQSAVDSGA